MVFASAMSDNEINYSRSFSGTAILWRKNLLNINRTFK